LSKTGTVGELPLLEYPVASCRADVVVTAKHLGHGYHGKIKVPGDVLHSNAVFRGLFAIGLISGSPVFADSPAIPGGYDPCLHPGASFSGEPDYVFF